MNITELTKQYVSYRKTLGEKIKSTESYLRLFCNVIGKDTDIKVISAKQVKDFLYSQDEITSTWFTKHAALNGFFCYAINRRYTDSSPLPTILPKKPASIIPYIYTREELRKIFAIALVYKKRQTHIDSRVIRVILILLYSMGLRLSEALSLTMDDIDVTQQVITIRETKFYKTRILPYDICLSNVIAEYTNWRELQCLPKTGDIPFFIDAFGNPIKMDTMEKIFQRIREIANIKRSDSTKHHPRLHDLRHTFAVNRLTSWYKENADVQKLLPLLSTYMGHTQLAATSVYLTITADLLHEAGMRFKQYAMGEQK